MARKNQITSLQYAQCLTAERSMDDLSVPEGEFAGRTNCLPRIRTVPLPVAEDVAPIAMNNNYVKMMAMPIGDEQAQLVYETVLIGNVDTFNNQKELHGQRGKHGGQKELQVTVTALTSPEFNQKQKQNSNIKSAMQIAQVDRNAFTRKSHKHNNMNNNRNDKQYKDQHLYEMHVACKTREIHNSTSQTITNHRIESIKS